MTESELNPYAVKARRWLDIHAEQVVKDNLRLKSAGALYSRLEDIASESGDEYWDWKDGSRTHARAVFEVLDEAAKEFGKLKTMLEIWEWFEKWFGEQP